MIVSLQSELFSFDSFESKSMEISGHSYSGVYQHEMVNDQKNRSAFQIDSFDSQSYPLKMYDRIEKYVASEVEAGRLSLREYAFLNFTHLQGLHISETQSIMESVMSANRLLKKKLELRLGIPLVQREAKDTYIVTTGLNLADIIVVKTGIKYGKFDGDETHLFSIIDTGSDSLAALCGNEMLITSNAGYIGSALVHKKPLWPGFSLWYKALHNLRFDTKLEIENIIISHHHTDHIAGLNSLMQSKYIHAGKPVFCDMLPTKEDGLQVKYPTVLWSSNIMSAFQTDNRAARYAAFGNAEQFGHNLPDELVIFPFVKFPPLRSSLEALTKYNPIDAAYMNTMSKPKSKLTEKDKNNILKKFNEIRELLLKSSDTDKDTILNNDTTLFDAQLQTNFQRGWFNHAFTSTATLDSIFRNHPITGKSLKLRDDLDFMKQVIESYSYAQIAMPISPKVFEVMGSMKSPYTFKANEKCFEMWNVDGEGSGSDLFIKWQDMKLNDLSDDNKPFHILSVQERNVTEQRVRIPIYHLADNFYPLYPNFESLRSPVRNVFHWVQSLFDVSIAADDNSIFLSGHSAGVGKMLKLLKSRKESETSTQYESDRKMIYDYARDLKSVELCALHNINYGKEVNEAVKVCSETAPFNPLLFQGYGSIRAHVDSIYKLNTGGWHFDVTRALVKSTSIDALNMLVHKVSVDEVQKMARNIQRQAEDEKDVSLFTLALELVDFIFKTTYEIKAEIIVMKLEILSAIYNFESNATIASMLLREIMKTSVKLAREEGYEHYIIDNNYNPGRHPLNLKKFNCDKIN